MEMRVEIVIAAPAEDAWAVVGDHFGEIGQWASAITASAMDGRPAVGQVRACQVAGFGPIAAGVITERLVSFDPAARSLFYEAVERREGTSRIYRADKAVLGSLRAAVEDHWRRGLGRVKDLAEAEQREKDGS